MLSENIVLLRKMYAYSQEEVAERIGISRQAYAKWESGDTIPDVERCSRLAQLYDTTLDSILNFNRKIKNIKMPPAPKGKHIFGTVTINEQGQMTLPKEAIDHFDLKTGDCLVVLGQDDEGLALVEAKIFEERMNFIIEQINGKNHNNKYNSNRSI